MGQLYGLTKWQVITRLHPPPRHAPNPNLRVQSRSHVSCFQVLYKRSNSNINDVQKYPNTNFRVFPWSLIYVKKRFDSYLNIRFCLNRFDSLRIQTVLVWYMPREGRDWQVFTSWIILAPPPLPKDVCRRACAFRFSSNNYVLFSSLFQKIFLNNVHLQLIYYFMNVNLLIIVAICLMLKVKTK
jgi:hypothetical protein